MYFKKYKFSKFLCFKEYRSRSLCEGVLLQRVKMRWIVFIITNNIFIRILGGVNQTLRSSCLGEILSYPELRFACRLSTLNAFGVQ